MRQHGTPGPDCPHCGCNVTEVVEAGMRYGRAWIRFRCDHCDRVSSTATSPPADDSVGGVVYNPVNCICPRCGAVNPKVHTTRGRVRYHTCKCGAGFKSVEKSR